MAADRTENVVTVPAKRLALFALLVFAGCYAGARAGTLVVFPQVGAAVVFLPYAVLAAALILSPVRHWWLYIAASAMGNLWPHIQHEGVVSFVLVSELSNIIRAVVAAAGIRWLGGNLNPFASLRGVIPFLLFAVMVGPAAGAFVGALGVTRHNPGTDFGLAWQAWLLSNTLTALTVLPLILLVVYRAPAWSGRASVARTTEGSVLAIGVLAVGAYIFDSSTRSIVPAALYVPLPLLLWAALRFGSGGMIAALTSIAALTIGGAVLGRGPFVSDSPAEDLLQLQHFLIALCVPLLLLGVIVEQQKRTLGALVRSQTNYRALVEDQSEMVCQFQLDGTFTFANGAFCRRFNKSKDEILTLTLWALMPPEAVERVRTCIASISAEQPITVLELEFEGSDGEKCWQEWVFRGLLTGHGRIEAYQAVGRDTTKSRQFEDSLRSALQEVSRLREQLEAQNAYLQEELSSSDHVGEVICRSAVMRQTLSQVQRVAATDTTVLILGETGTGKELIAKTIHESSDRRGRPFVRLNCAALPVHLIESELFGHERGAFTGAVARRLGRFEIANGSTLLLDEMGELPLELQAKLLRVLQEGECERLGSSETIKVDVRLIAATNRNLAECVQRGTFRADLYYRLNVYPVTVPPLRSRTEDIVPLATVFLTEIGQRLGKTFSPINNATAKALLQYSWPGNVRELENVIERAAISSKGEDLQLPASWEGSRFDDSQVHVPSSNGNGNGSAKPQISADTSTVGVSPSNIHEMERNHIVAVLERTKWRIEGPAGAAVMLGLKAGTLRFKMKKLGISRPLAT